MSSESSTGDLPIRHIARALVFDPADRLLLIEYQSVHSHGPRTFWFMPGGGMEPGETPIEACRRELSEEIGVHDAEIGPLVATCDGPFRLFNKSRDARERYFVVRLPNDRVDTSRLADMEDNPVRGTRWWSLADLAGTDARIEPRGLAELVRRIISGDVPADPVRLHWHEP